MRFHLLLAFVPMIFVSGCGGDGTSIQGSIAGKRFASVQAVSGSITNPGQQSGMFIVMSDVADLCARLSGTIQPSPNVQELSFDLFVSDGTANTSLPTASGDYVVATSDQEKGQLVTAQYESTGATISDITMIPATAGKVTLDSPSHDTGSFDLTFGSDHVTGTFAPTVCAALNL